MMMMMIKTEQLRELPRGKKKKKRRRRTMLLTTLYTSLTSTVAAVARLSDAVSARLLSKEKCRHGAKKRLSVAESAF